MLQTNSTLNRCGGKIKDPRTRSRSNFLSLQFLCVMLILYKLGILGILRKATPLRIWYPYLSFCCCSVTRAVRPRIMDKHAVHALLYKQSRPLTFIMHLKNRTMSSCFCSVCFLTGDGDRRQFCIGGVKPLFFIHW